jgi:hydroxyethylthiazole kinase-like uncharacterized protein yjeF
LNGHEILTVAQTAEADRRAIAGGVDALDLVRKAGAAVAAAVTARWTPGRALVLCGPGLNGADGYIAARELAAAGWSVTVAALADPVGDVAERARAEWNGEVVALAPALVDQAELVIDALFGAGLSRPLDLPALDVFRRVEATGRPLVAVDLPSGLAGDTGAPLAYAPRATVTVTFHRLKPAHVLQPGRSLCGRIVLADIGIAMDAAPVPALAENGPHLWLSRFPWPREDSHKHDRGRLGVVSGMQVQTGAARLAARAGLRIGAGLVRLYMPPDAVTVNAPHLEGVMMQPFETDAQLEQLADVMDAVVIGPAAGLNDETMANLAALARTGAAMVIDADALTVFKDDVAELFGVLDRDDVLTPHTGEFDRLFPSLLKSTPERITATRQAAQRAGAIVLLKGPDTVIAAPDGRAVVNTNGTAWLATAGAGDVLAGLIGGLIAQGMDSFDAACAGAWIHAQAARRFGPGLIAEDLPELTPGVLKALHELSFGPWDAD